MILTEIYIENQRLDLYKDISAELTYNIDDVRDFASRNTNFSKTIILPGNATNNKIFGHIFEFGSGNLYNPSQPNVGYNYNASKSAQCIIYIDKIQIFKGVLRLLEIVIDRGTIEYECAVFGELGGFVSAIGNSKIEELDFSAYDQTWDELSIVNSWNTIDGTGLYFPLIDYGLVSTNKHDWKYSAMRPAFYVHEIVDKIITNSGYTYESDFFNTDLFKRLVIPNNQKVLSAYSTIGFSGYVDEGVFNASGSPTPLPNLAITSTLAGAFTGSLGNTRWTYNGATPITGSFTVVLNGYKFSQPNEEPLYFSIAKNGSYTGATGTNNVSGEQPIALEFTSDLITLNTNDYFELAAYWQSWIDPLGMDWDLYGGCTIVFNTQATTIVPLNYGETITCNSILPRGIFQKDFFASIIKMFNLYVVEDSFRTKHLNITPYIDFYNVDPMHLRVNEIGEEYLVDDNDFLLLNDPYQDVIDWTNKLDRSKPLKVKPMSELNGRYYEYKYQSDSDYYNEQYAKKYVENYADFIEDTGYEFAKEKQTAQIIFASTPLVGYVGEDKVYSTIFKLNGAVEEGIDHKIRILQAKKLTGYSNWNMLADDGTTTILTLDYVGYAGHLDDPDNPLADINFGAPKELYYVLSTQYPSANLFNGFWSDYLAEITDKDSKLLQCNILLTNQDIFSLDFSNLILIDNSLWRLNKVMDYNPIVYDTTKCEFLKVIEITYE